jgi:SAM-dependent methyltransferase
MRRIILPVPIYLPQFLYEAARRAKYALGTSHRLDLSGDRDIEWSWVAANIADSSDGQALEVGPDPDAFLGLIAAQRGYHVTGVDLEMIKCPHVHPQVDIIQGDILQLDLPMNQFDLIINCSVVEHIGLIGRYGVSVSRAEGDLEAMQRLRAIMKSDARMLLTVPVGNDAVFPPLHRVYGSKRLPRLLSGFIVDKKEFWIKNAQNRWVPVPESEALNSRTEEKLYGLGCFVLQRR